MAKLNAASVLKIRSEYANEKNMYQLASKYGVSQPCISDIILRKRRNHI
jgi:hypothetical protein